MKHSPMSWRRSSPLGVLALPRQDRFALRGRSVRLRPVCDGLNTKSGEAENYQ